MYFNIMNKKLLIMCGPNVIESKEHVMYMAKELKKIAEETLLNTVL